MSEPTRDAAWWGREVDRLAEEIQARYHVPDEPMEQLMRAMMLAAGTKPQGEPPIPEGGPASVEYVSEGWQDIPGKMP